MNDQSSRLRRRPLLLGAASLLGSPAPVRAQSPSNGVALVIGNSRYHWEAPLPNVRRDAPDVAKRLQALGLKVELIENAGRDAMLAALEKFRAAAQGAGFAAFYFAGHGASWDKETYLVPVDTDLGKPEVVRTLVPVEAVNAASSGASHRLIVLDNCRNNPADGWRQRVASEAARITVAEQTATALQGPNTLVLFSTAPGQVALDGPPGENSPFAAALLRQLQAAPIDLTTLPARLRRDLLIATEGRQLLWDQSTYTESFAIGPSRGTAPASPAARPIIDPSRIVELPNAYAFAQESKLSLPSGLVAIRPSHASPYAQRVGAFKSRTRVTVGATATMGAMIVAPIILAILSIGTDDAATAIYSSKQYFAGNGSAGNGQSWRLVSGKLADNKFTFLPIAGFWGGRMPFTAKWSDANSGRFEMINQGGGDSLQQSERMTRLD